MAPSRQQPPKNEALFSVMISTYWASLSCQFRFWTVCRSSPSQTRIAVWARIFAIAGVQIGRHPEDLAQDEIAQKHGALVSPQGVGRGDAPPLAALVDHVVMQQRRVMDHLQHG